jgi:hypothetical protein
MEEKKRENKEEEKGIRHTIAKQGSRSKSHAHAER